MTTLRNLDEARAARGRRLGGAGDERLRRALRAAFDAAMDDDLETSGAMAAVHDMLAAANRGLAAGSLAPEDAASALALLDLADRVLGLGLGASRTREASAEQKRLLDERAKARAEKRWQDSDRLRDELRALGIEVKDVKGAQDWTFL